MKKVYHLDLNDEVIHGAKIAFVPGDPDRVPFLAKKIDANAIQLARKREYNTNLAFYGKTAVLVTSTGIGGPSTAIAVEELAQLGVTSFIRVGTTGAIQPEISVTDIIITNASVRLDGTSTHYAPLSYPAVSNFEITRALFESAKKQKLNFHIGITASSDSFYPGQERYDTFSNYVIRNFQGSLKEFQKLNVLNYEMESASLFTVCNALKLKAGCVAGVIVNRSFSEKIDETLLKIAEENTIKAAIGSLDFLL